jgi:predicted hydrolase (HD superfamily)
MLPTREQATELLFKNVTDEYQRHHALMVGTALAGYAKLFGEDEREWFTTGYLHDLDFQQYPQSHPGESMKWFADWGYSPELIHAVHAHAYGYNGYTQEPETRLAAALIACDEICGIFYAYRKINPQKYGEMKQSSILKRLREKSFAPGIKREDIEYGCNKLGVSLEDHVANLINFLGELE